MENARHNKNEMYQKFDLHFHIGENTVFVVFRAWGKALFVRTCIEAVHLQSHAMMFARTGGTPI
jgi:hypothetical protein